MITESHIINELYNAKLQDNGHDALECDFLKFVSQVQAGFRENHLDLCKFQFGQSLLSKLPRVFRLYSKITHLYLYGNLIRDDGIQRVMSLVQSYPNIVYIDIGSNDMSDKSLVCIVDLILLKQITSFHIGNRNDLCQANRFSRSTLSSMLEAMAKNNIIKCLGIEGIGNMKQKKTQQYRDFSKVLSKTIATCSNLSTLDISRSGLVDSDQSILGAGFKANNSLRYLDINNNFFPGSTKLIEGIVTLSNLRYLDVSNCQLNGSAVTLISQQMESGWKLINLNLSKNQIGNDGISNLFKSLTNNIYLVVLNVSDTGFDQEVTPCFESFIQNSQVIEDIDLSCNNIGDSIADCFKSIFDFQETLVTLSIASCRITDEGAVKIAHALESNTTLKKLDMSDNFFTKGQGYELVQIFQKNETLLTLDLSSNQIDCFALEAIKALCVRNKATAHNKRLEQLRKEYIHLSIQNAKIPGVLDKLDMYKSEHTSLSNDIAELDNEIEQLQNQLDIQVSTGQKAVSEFHQMISTEEEQIKDMQEKIEELTAQHEVRIKDLKAKAEIEKTDFDNLEKEATKIEVETVESQKEAEEMQEKLNAELLAVDELLAEVQRTTRNKKKLREYEIPEYPYAEEEAKAQEEKEGTISGRAAALAREMEELDAENPIDLDENVEEKKGKKGSKKKGGGKSKKSTKRK